VAIDRIMDAGNGTKSVFTGKWTPGWTNIVALQLHGKPHLFSYKGDDDSLGFPIKPDVGHIALDRINDTGTGTTNLVDSKWTPGWSSIAAFHLAGTPHLFSYRAADGAVAIDRVNG
jgi:hypothetical protein